ncbi:MAG: flagella basal body P-ring formation protein FlgA [Sphingomonas sp.]
MILFAAILAAAPAAEPFQSTVVLDAVVAQFTGKQVGELGGARAPVDARLKLAACPAPQLEWRNETRDAVLVRCMAPGWRVYVPVNAAPQPKPAGQAPARAVPAAKAEPVIRRGDPVTIEAGAAGFSITREGVAMGDAAPGARLLVKVDEKKPPIQAVAVEQGLARLPGTGE